MKRALKGNAARLLSSITVTDANYAIARDILSDRFQNKRALVKAHIKAMMSIPKGHQENVGILRNVQEILDQNRRALENQGVNVKECDFLLLHLVTEKLDPETRKEWELSSTGSDLQTYDQFKDFLERRCRALESSCEVSKSQKFQSVLPASAKHSSETRSSQWRSSGSRPPENGSSKTGVYSGVAELCFCCGENHRIQACQTFNDLITEDKLKMVNLRACVTTALERDTQQASVRVSKNVGRVAANTTLSFISKDYGVMNLDLQRQGVRQVLVTILLIPSRSRPCCLQQ